MELSANQDSQVKDIAALIGGDPVPEKKPDADPEGTDADEKTNGLDTEHEAQPAIESQPEATPDSSDESPDEVIEQEDKTPTLTDLAETLDLSEKDLYGVEVPMRGVDETVTLGDLKDAWKAHRTITQERETYDTRREQQVNEMMVADRQLNQFIDIAKSTGQLSKEVLDKLNELHSNNIAQQQRTLMTAIPEWHDPQTRNNDFEDLVKFLGDGYGFTRAQVANTTNAMYLKIAFDAMKAQNLVSDHRRAKPKPTNIKQGAVGIKPNKNAALNAKIKAAKGGNNEQKASAIADLLNTSKG